jgi:hypothetical protein
MTLRLNGSTSGYTEIDAPAVGGNNTFQLPTNAPTTNNSALVCGTNGAMAFADGPLAGTRNRIINGDMRIDQRNAGAAVTINSTNNTYTLDRWFASGENTDGVFTVDQTTDAPAGFSNSTRITTTTADASIGSTQAYLFRQPIEGYNIYDLAFGTASAKAFTISFWIKSSLTGTFGGALNNSANDRNYPFTYSISAANIWEYKTISVAGDTTGTWLTDAGRGITLTFQIGAGSSRIAAAGSWTSTSSIYGATGATNVIGTLNATWDITGVQLEAGSVATPFERRSYGQELALASRYYQKNGSSTSTWIYMCKGREQDRLRAAGIQLPVTMRAAPTVTVIDIDKDGSTNNVSVTTSNPNGAGVTLFATSDGQAPYIRIYSAEAEL